ncbi:alpha/beta-hydrolase family protein [Arthrobacter sp. CAN_C5]|uniref:alpha/beta hydrolase n=1 Tax=Arthrobacter sp. CAN_C5 TaxID=2760706 RepID=UPI001AE73BAF|nr:alpha/beta-hydrolase family protein [Arthrobacter sp. CAN_C5]MBP2214909.1 putative membrane protein [Arthrobacter sp. CAN_C5]
MRLLQGGAVYLRDNWINLLCALALASLALTPSLVPRPTVFQGFLAGLWLMVGFQLGFALRSLGRVAARRFGPVAPRRQPRATVPPRSAVRLGLMVGAGVVAYAVGYGALVMSWQNEVRALVEMEPIDGPGYLTAFLSMLATGALCFGIFRGISGVRALVSRVVARRGASPRAARWVGRGAGLAVTVVLVAILVGAGLVAVGQIYEGRDAQTLAGSGQPTVATRSGSPQSALEWDGLGRQGRAFAGGGPSAANIGAVTGTAAVEPVRVYAGLSQGANVVERADLVVEELERAGGFDREVLLVATPTGSGWLEPQAIASLEYLFGGDTATASMQYSFQPSWVSFLFDPELAADSSRALFDAVYERWEGLPEDTRPRLAVYGLSLGAQGMQGSFAGLADLLFRTDAALFTGPPANSQPWRTLQENRDAGSPVWQPTYQQGRDVRWQSKPGDFGQLGGEWRQPRLGYLQHATDPITWLDPAVMIQRPEWLAGPAATGGRGVDVSDSMRWIPGVTFLHLVTDMLVSEAVPPSHGHNFGDVAVDGWAQVLPGHGRSSEQLAAIQSVIERIDTHDPIWE